MGYDLYITRRADWNDAPFAAISETEWRSLIESDPELDLDLDTVIEMAEGRWIIAAWKGEPGMLGYWDGEIRAKNPCPDLVKKMVNLARALDARVMGDDGETYGESGEPERSQSPSANQTRRDLIGRVRAWLHNRRGSARPVAPAPMFGVGDRVRNPWGETGTVVHLDRRANSGLGSVRVRFDDGREQDLACIATGLEIIEDHPRR